MANASKVLGKKIEYADSAYSCVEGADAALVVTEWEEFRKIAPSDLKERMRQPHLIDGRRIYDPETYGSKLVYSAVGLGKKN
jgi:UDPglucose 6-dehydrogenase